MQNQSKRELQRSENCSNKTDNAVNQSKLEGNACSRREARENVHEREVANVTKPNDLKKIT